MTHWSIYGKECEITLEPRPAYCDRGEYLAKLFPRLGSHLARDLDAADLWPRYFMDLRRAKLEIEAWLKKRDQWIEGEAWTEH